MNSYDFTTLNDKEFEAFAIDLLSSERGVHIERFKPGRDEGVDGRWFTAEKREIIVQCKHWVRTGIRGLLRHLRESERAKVDRLKPAKYILVTSVPLSRQYKQEIRKIFDPYFFEESDVLGPQDLNDQLGRHGDVEKRHYKLWLTSSNALSLILHSAVLGRSRFELESIREEAAIYVATADFARAWRHLNDRRVIILTGEPGIGKTTLARQLILDHVSNGFELISIEEDVSEAEAVFDAERKQVFYFDDFLGRTFLEALRPKQDSHALSFINRVARDPLKRFVLTSRTNILNQGAVLSDLLRSAAVLKGRYELEVGKLRPIDRARILYNHVWHSKLTEEYIDQLYVDKRYHHVIKHKNFNPRLISFLLDQDKVSDLPPESYWSHVEQTLENPEEVWDHFFNSQLDQDCRDLVYFTVLNGGSIMETLLRDTFFSHRSRDKQLNSGEIFHRYRIAVRHSVDSVLNRELPSGGGEARYSLFNPSIADYVLRYLSGSPLWREYYPHLRTLSALRQLEQLGSESFFGSDTYQSVLMSFVEQELEGVESWDSFALRLARLVVEEPGLREQYGTYVSRWVTSSEQGFRAFDIGDYIRVVAGVEVLLPSEQYAQSLTNIPGVLMRVFTLIDEAEAVVSLINLLGKYGLEDAIQDVRAQIIGEWESNVAEIIEGEGFLDSEFDVQDARSALENVVYSRVKDAGIAISSKELGEICAKVDLDEIVERNYRRTEQEDLDVDSPRRLSAYPVCGWAGSWV
jgi:hypothetical protein